MWHDSFYVEYCAMKGLASSGNNQGVPADALIGLLKHHGVDEVLKMGDNFCLFHVPVSITTDKDGVLVAHFSTDIDLVLMFTSLLGIPWHPVAIKGQCFTSTVTYVSFLWDLDNHMVSLLP